MSRLSVERRVSPGHPPVHTSGRFRRKSDRARLVLAAGLGAMWAVRNLRLGAYTLEGKTVLITGGSRGLGLALAREVMVQGAQVAICGRDAASLERAETGLKKIGDAVVAVSCDVTRPAEVESLLNEVRSKLGPVDVLINNAGVIEVGPAETMSLADYEEAMATNFWGMLYPTLAVLPEMRQRKSAGSSTSHRLVESWGFPTSFPTAPVNSPRWDFPKDFGPRWPARGSRW